MFFLIVAVLFLLNSLSIILSSTSIGIVRENNTVQFIFFMVTRLIIIIITSGAIVMHVYCFRSSLPVVFSWKGILKMCNKCTTEHHCQSVISIKLLCDFIEIALWQGCSPVNLLHIFRTPFSKNTCGGLLRLFVLIKAWKWIEKIRPKSCLTHFSPMSHFYTPWKRKKTYGFLAFSGGIEKWHWTKIA